MWLQTKEAFDAAPHYAALCVTPVCAGLVLAPQNPEGQATLAPARSAGVLSRVGHAGRSPGQPLDLAGSERPSNDWEPSVRSTPDPGSPVQRTLAPARIAGVGEGRRDKKRLERVRGFLWTG